MLKCETKENTVILTWFKRDRWTKKNTLFSKYEKHDLHHYNETLKKIK